MVGTRPPILALLALVALAGPVAGQLPEAEDAFDRGDYRTARMLYDSVLARDSLSPRALYRLAIFDGWDGHLKASLARFAKLRRLEPQDADIMVAHARVLSWNGQTRWSEALYDSVLARDPSRADAMAGRARGAAWSGDLARAERLWRDALERHPDDPEILTGLAQTLYWEDEPTQAEVYVARARVLAPGDRATQDLFDMIRAERRPSLSVTSDGADDIDHSRFVTIAGTFSVSLASAVRGTLRTSWRRNEQGALVGTSRGLEGWLVHTTRSGLTLRAGMGARQLDADSGTRTLATVQAGLGLRPARSATVNIAYARYPFDETALLVRRGFVWDELDVSAEMAPNPNLELSLAGNAAWLSDGNRRLIGSAAALVGVAPGIHVGASVRIMGYPENPRRGYFAPNRFTIVEGQATYVRRWQGWAFRATGGLGAQQIEPVGAIQAEWHGDVTLSHRWRAIDELALVALYTNSAAARTGTDLTETYRYWSVGLRYRKGL